MKEGLKCLMGYRTWDEAGNLVERDLESFSMSYFGAVIMDDKPRLVVNGQFVELHNSTYVLVYDAGCRKDARKVQRDVMRQARHGFELLEARFRNGEVSGTVLIDSEVMDILK